MKAPGQIISAIADARVSIDELLDSYKKFIDDNSRDGKVCPTIGEFEAAYEKLTAKTREIWADLISATIEGVDEREIVASKKENT